MKKYGLIFFFTLFGLLSGFSIFNLIIDPYAATAWVSIEGINERKSRAHEDGRRVLVSHQLFKRAEHSIIIGSSRVVDGFPDTSNDWPGGLYNAGLRGSNAYELAHVAALAKQKDDLRCIIVGMDVSEFSGGEKFKSAFLISRFTDGLRWKSLGRMMLSPNTFMRSFQTIKDNLTGGSDDPPFKDVYEPGEQRNRFIASAKGSYNVHLNLYMAEERIDYLFTALEALAKDGIQVIGFIHPVHAWYEEPLLRAGQEESYFELKNILVQKFDELAQLHVPKKPCVEGDAFPLWDFSGFRAPSTTDLPGEDQTSPHATYHEPAHYNFGQDILGAMMGEGTGHDLSDIVRVENLIQLKQDVLSRREAYLQTQQGQMLNEIINAIEAEPSLTNIQPLTKSDWEHLEHLLQLD